MHTDPDPPVFERVFNVQAVIPRILIQAVANEPLARSNNCTTVAADVFFRGDSGCSVPGIQLRIKPKNDDILVSQGGCW